MPRITPPTICLLALATLGVPQASEAAQMQSIPTEQYLRSLISSSLSSQSTDVGIVVGVLDATSSVVVSQGYTDSNHSHLVDGDTLFEIGDVTKVFTGMLLADMLKRGEVKLTDPISKYLPERTLIDGRADSVVPLIDLATSSIGDIWNLPNLSARQPVPALAGFSSLPLNVANTSANSVSAVSRPYQLSDLGYGLLGQAMAKRLKTSYQQVLTQRILRPLAMEDTHVGLVNLPAGRIAFGQDADLKMRPAHVHPNVLVSADGITSSANDLMKFLRAIIDQRFTKFAFAFRESLSVRRATRSPETLSSLGWAIRQIGSTEIVWRSSELDGYSIWIGVDLATKRGAVVLVTLGSSVATDIGFRALSWDTGEGQQRPTIGLKRSRLETFSGQYRINDGRLLTVAREKEHLTLALHGQTLGPAYAESDRRFSAPQTGLKFTFDYETESQSHPGRIVIYQGDLIEIADRVREPELH